MSDEICFEPGDVVQLRSGGPLLTVTYANPKTTSVIYFNSVTGKYDEFETPQLCLRSANQAPQTPANASALRHTTVAKSSMS